MKIIRVHAAFSSEIEKYFLNKLSAFLYSHISANQLSAIALTGALICGLSYYFAGKISLNFLHLANLGIFIHWFGDSLDGRVARLRKENRPLYGFYLDHILDAISLTIITFGIGYSQLTLQSSWVWVLTLFLLLMIHSFLKASATGIFELAFERFGPTEGRLFLIGVNVTALMLNNRIILTEPIALNVFDLFGTASAFVMAFFFLRIVLRTLLDRGQFKEN